MHSQNCTQNEQEDEEQGDEMPLNGKPSVVGSPVRLTVGKTHSLRQVVELQNAAHAAGEVLARDILKATDRKERAIIASALARLCSSWTVLQDAKREIRGKGRVKPVDAKTTVPKRTSFDVDEQPA